MQRIMTFTFNIVAQHNAKKPDLILHGNVQIVIIASIECQTWLPLLPVDNIRPLDNLMSCCSALL